MTEKEHAAGDTVPADCVLIEVRVAELKQLLNQMDPSPFHERDLDPKAEEFIVGWAEESRPDVPFALQVHLDRPAGLPEEAKILGDAIREFFRQRCERLKRDLRQLFRRGRISLAIGLLFLASLIALGDLVADLRAGPLGGILRESLLIGGWVAMWRPLEIFLYDWWPIRGRIRLYVRLSGIAVRIVYSDGATSEAWRNDWPAQKRSVGTEVSLST